VLSLVCFCACTADPFLCAGLQLYEPPRPVAVETDQERSERERLEMICKEVEILLSEGSLARDRYLRALVDAKSGEISIHPSPDPIWLICRPSFLIRCEGLAAFKL